MVFTEDCIAIKFLLQNKGYSARRLIKEFPLKIWKNGGLKKLLKKIDDKSTTGLPGNGRRRTAGTDENVEGVADGECL